MTIVVLDSAAEDIKAGRNFYDSREAGVGGTFNYQFGEAFGVRLSSAAFPSIAAANAKAAEDSRTPRRKRVIE